MHDSTLILLLSCLPVSISTAQEVDQLVSRFIWSHSDIWSMNKEKVDGFSDGVAGDHCRASIEVITRDGVRAESMV